MQDPKKQEEKLQGGDIHVPPTLRARRREREHGRVYKWFDNFWYHHKWKTIISLSLAVIILVCTLQMCQREEAGDLSIVLAGPYAFTTENTNKADLEKCLSLYLPSDYNGDGKRSADLVIYSLYSKEQIEELRNRVDENGDPAPIQINTMANSQEYNNYNTYKMTGESPVMLLDPWLFEEMAGNSEHLAEIEALFSTVPQGAIYVTDADGVSRCFGVRLGDTALYQNNIAIQVLSPDSVLCIMHPLAYSSEESYHQSVAYFASLVGISAS